MSLGSFLDRLAGAKSPQPIERKAAKDPEAPAERVPASPKVRQLPLTAPVLTVAAVAVGLSFFLGMALQKAHDNTMTKMLLGTNGFHIQNGTGSGFGGGYGNLGRASMSTSTVTAVSSSSITVRDSSGNSKTYAITDQTFITDNGLPAAASDISSGDMVIVIPSRDDSATARRIIDDPNLNGQSVQPQIDPNQTQVD